MQRKYTHYTKWEDWHHGMYETNPIDPNTKLRQATQLLKDPTNLYYAMQHVANNWHHSANHNLTNQSQNHQAWLGQAACAYKHNTPHHLTKEAWRSLTDQQRHNANQTADTVLAEWKATRYTQNTLFNPNA